MDIADALDCALPDGFAGSEAPLTSRHDLPADPVLRNL
jgi:hypothetical protein